MNIRKYQMRPSLTCYDLSASSFWESFIKYIYMYSGTFSQFVQTNTRPRVEIQYLKLIFF